MASTYSDFASYTDLCLLLYEGLKHSLYDLDNVSESELKMSQHFLSGSVVLLIHEHFDSTLKLAQNFSLLMFQS